MLQRVLAGEHATFACQWWSLSSFPINVDGEWISVKGKLGVSVLNVFPLSLKRVNGDADCIVKNGVFVVELIGITIWLKDALKCLLQSQRSFSGD